MLFYAKTMSLEELNIINKSNYYSTVFRYIYNFITKITVLALVGYSERKIP